MARKDTYKRTALDDMFDDIENNDIKGESLDIQPVVAKNPDEEKSDKIVKPEKSINIEETRKTEVDQPTESVVKKASKPSSRKKKFSPVDFSKKAPTTATRSFRLPVEVDEHLTDIVTDSRGKRIPGSQGFLKTFANNAIIKELVAIGYLDESHLDKLIPYE